MARYRIGLGVLAALGAIAIIGTGVKSIIGKLGIVLDKENKIDKERVETWRKAQETERILLKQRYEMGAISKEQYEEGLRLQQEIIKSIEKTH